MASLAIRRGCPGHLARWAVAGVLIKRILPARDLRAVVSSRGRRWLVSRAGGTEPVWSRTSPELFFRQNDAVVGVAGRPPFQGAVTLFDAPWTRSNAYTRATYDVAPDGQGFLMIRRVDPDARIHVILNWSDELKRRVSSAR
jgi:hypothetical protein